MPQDLVVITNALPFKVPRKFLTQMAINLKSDPISIVTTSYVAFKDVDCKITRYILWTSTSLLKIFCGTIGGRTVGRGDTTVESPVLSMVYFHTLWKVSSGGPPIMIHVPLVEHCKPLIPTGHHI